MSRRYGEINSFVGTTKRLKRAKQRLKSKRRKKETTFVIDLLRLCSTVVISGAVINYNDTLKWLKLWIHGGTNDKSNRREANSKSQQTLKTHYSTGRI